MRYLDLFAGIGGFSLGIKQAYEELQNGESSGGLGQEESLSERFMSDSSSQSDERQYPTCIGYSEIDKYAIQVYNKQFNHKNYGDITKIDEKELPDFDLLVGGFPCQAFSIAGERGGFNDTRGRLFYDITRILRYKQPRLFILENVKGFITHDNGNTFRACLGELDGLGYDVQWQVLNSKNFGVPQSRERLFIIGHLRETPRPKVFPITRINNLHLREITQGVSDAQRIYKKQNIAKTIKALGGGLGAKTGLYQMDDYRIRRLTPKECERLQGFPDGWTEGLSDTQRYKTLGNAVTVNVIKEIIKLIIKNK